MKRVEIVWPMKLKQKWRQTEEFRFRFIISAVFHTNTIHWMFVFCPPTPLPCWCSRFLGPFSVRLATEVACSPPLWHFLSPKEMVYGWALRTIIISIIVYEMLLSLVNCSYYLPILLSFAHGTVLGILYYDDDGGDGNDVSERVCMCLCVH